jgi:hypothetical protein
MTRPIRAQQMTLHDLRRRCAEETARFFRGGTPDNAYCFELFRRALHDGDEQAWQLIYAQYEPEAVGWVRRHPQFELTGEDVDFFVNQAFASMWKAWTPDHFERFPNLPALLSYLQSCVATSILQYMRRVPDVTEDEPLDSAAATPAPAPQPYWREEFWRLVSERLNDEKELVVLEYQFVLDLKPREIYAQFPKMFSDVREVYRTRDNILRRLRRDPELQEFIGVDA